ncbi:hypothetical protein MTO96_003410 [Rhipicephalus appendiculatus]
MPQGQKRLSDFWGSSSSKREHTSEDLNATLRESKVHSLQCLRYPHRFCSPAVGMDFESPDVEKDFPGLYASEAVGKGQERDVAYSDDEKVSKKELLIGKLKDKKDKKDKGYVAFEGESSEGEMDESRGKNKKSKAPFKFPGKEKKEKAQKSKESVKSKDSKEAKKDADKDNKDSKKKKESKVKLVKKKKKAEKAGTYPEESSH